MFYVSISEQSNASKEDTTASPKQTLSWPCFEGMQSVMGHSDDQTSAAAGLLRRTVIDHHHGIWEHLELGTRIEVSAKTKTLIAPNRDCEAVIRVYKTWEPSAEMLKLLYTFKWGA